MTLSREIETETAALRRLCDQVAQYAKILHPLPPAELGEVLVRVKDCRTALQEDLRPILKSAGPEGGDATAADESPTPETHHVQQRPSTIRRHDD